MTTAIMNLNEGMATNGATSQMLSFAVDGYDAIKTVYNAVNNAETMEGHDGEEFTLLGIIQNPDVVVDPVTNVERDCISTVLITDSGNYFSRSAGIAKSARNLMNAFAAAGGWPSDPVTVSVVSRKLDNRRTWKSLELK